MKSLERFYADMTAAGATSIFWRLTPILEIRESVDRWLKNVSPRCNPSEFKNAIYSYLPATRMEFGSGRRSAGTIEKILALSQKKFNDRILAIQTYPCP
jgi:hypothetical protein